MSEHGQTNDIFQKTVLKLLMIAARTSSPSQGKWRLHEWDVRLYNYPLPQVRPANARLLLHVQLRGDVLGLFWRSTIEH
jgi:hypothetical protein